MTVNARRVALALLVCLTCSAPAAAQNSLSGRDAAPTSPTDGAANHLGRIQDAEPATQPDTAAPADTAPQAGGQTPGQPAPTLTGEGIANFDSDETLTADGTLTVRETLTVNATGDQIRHGIFRDFPTDYEDRHGARVRVGFNVQSVVRDAKPEPYELYSISNGQEVKIGSASTIIDPGTHIYVITYTTTRQIGFFPGYDELYWNATGNGWRFTIAHATATVHLPPGASIIQSEFFTGEQGETGHDAVERRIDAHTIGWETTRALNPGEGLTIAVGFTKGIISAPTWWQTGARFFRDNAAVGIAALGVIVLTLYFAFAWGAVGRDPARGTIVPLFEPPKDISAAAARFISRMAYDRKAFAATLIAMASKGYITIKEDGGSYKLKRTEKSEDDAGLANTERAVTKALLSGRKEIALQQVNHDKVQSAISALQTALRNEDEGVYFVTNRKWFWWGILIVVATAFASAAMTDSVFAILPLVVPVGAWALGTAFLIHRAFTSWTTVIRGPGFKIWNVVGALIWTFFAALIAGLVGLGVLLAYNNLFPTFALAALVLQGVLAFVFYRLLKAPTAAGQKIRDQIEGFKMYLTAAEKDRLEMLHPPKVTPEVFEKFLPYAIALDCENAWSKQFEAQAAAAGMAPTEVHTYTPVWYSGTSFARLGTAAFATTMGGAIGTAAASAAVAPGTSSGSYHSSGGFSSGGFSGGGFSGGGGGGGGGGGW